MGERTPGTLRSGIDIPKIVAGALAAVCAAVVGSYLGVAGTLVGAALASVVGSVGTEVYHRSLARGAEKLQTLTPTFIRAPAAAGTPAVAAASEADSPSHLVPPRDRPRLRWGHVAIVAAALFVLAIGTLTVAELVSGGSVASRIGNGTKARSTLSGLFHPGHRRAVTPAPSTAPSRTAPAQVAPTPTAPATTAGPTTPAAPDPTPTAAPTTRPAAPTDDPQNQVVNSP